MKRRIANKILQKYSFGSGGVMSDGVTRFHMCLSKGRCSKSIMEIIKSANLAVVKRKLEHELSYDGPVEITGFSYYDAKGNKIEIPVKIK